MNSSVKKGIITATVLALVFAAGYALRAVTAPGGEQANAKTSSEVSTVSGEFIKAITSGNIDAAYSGATSSYKSRNSRDRVQTLSDTLKTTSPIVVNEEVYAGPADKAIYVATINNLPANQFGRTSGNFVINLVHLSTGWKVDSIQVY